MTITESNNSTIGSELPKVLVAEIPRDILRAALASVLPCLSNDKTRPILNTVNFKLSGGLLLAEGCDSYRLARYEIDLAGELGESFMIHANDVKDILNALKGNGYGLPILLTSSTNLNGSRSITLRIDDATLTVHEAPGTYPDTDALIPEAGIGEGAEGVSFNADFMATAAKIAKAMTTGKGKHAKASLMTLKALDFNKPSHWTIGGDGLGLVSFLLMPCRKP